MEIGFQQAMLEYQQQLNKGMIQIAYKGLLDFMMSLKTRFAKKYPDCFVSGSLYAGYMDMTYFSYIPVTLKPYGLKIAVVFLHQEFRFEVWLSGTNKHIQAKIWEIFKAQGWNKYPLLPDLEGHDAIIELPMVDQPDFSDLDRLADDIEKKTIDFAADVEAFLDHQK